MTVSDSRSTPGAGVDDLRCELWGRRGCPGLSGARRPRKSAATDHDDNDDHYHDDTANDRADDRADDDGAASDRAA